jgi:hypothetical protein
MKHTALLLSALFLALGLTAISRAQDGATTKPVPAAAAIPAAGAHKILICDFAQIIDKCTERKDIEEAFLRDRTAAEKNLLAQQEALQIRIKEIQKTTNLSDRDDKVYEALKTAITDKGALDADIAFRNLRDQDFLQRNMQELLRGARTFAKDIMISRKADLVLATKVGKIKLENKQDWQDEMGRRRVVCHTDEVDITRAVMEMMNEEYVRRKAAAGGKSAPVKKDK